MTIDELQTAARDRDVDRIRAIVSARPELLEAVCTNGWTPLIVAAYHGSGESIRSLLALGADPDHANAKGTTPLMYAKGHYLRTGDAGPMRVLLHAGADRHARDVAGLDLLAYVPADRRSEIEAIFDSVPRG